MNSVEFGTLFQFIRNGMNVKQDKSGRGLPITRIETISNAIVDGSRVGYAGLVEADCTDWLLRKGDILFSHINSVEHIGKCAVYQGRPEKLVHGMNLLCLRSDKTKLLPEFAKYLIRSPEFRARLSNFINKAVNQASVSIGNLKTIPVSIPAVAEQQRIAEVLDRAEALRVKRRAALAQLDTLTQAIFLNLFGDPITNERDWPIFPIGKLDLHIADGNYSSKYPTSSEFLESGIPFIRANNLRDLTVVENDLRFISPAKHHELQKGHLLEGDVLITTRGEIGNVAVVPRRFQDANINAQIVLLRPKETQLESRYLAYLLNLPQMKIRLQSYQNGVALKQLPIRQLVRVPVPVPPLPTQREFARRVRAVEKLKSAHRASLAEMDALFATLQHLAFRGEL